MKRRNLVEDKNCCTKLNGVRDNIEIHICLVLPSGLRTYLPTFLLSSFLSFFLPSFFPYLITYLLPFFFTYLLTPCSPVLLEKLNDS
jgi:hypothetical protein